MKTKLLLSISTSLLTLLSAATSNAAVVTASGSGNWDSTSPNAPWPGGTPPAATDDVVVGPGSTVTVVNPASANSLQINGSGAVNNNSTLTVNGDIFGTGTLSQGLNAVLNVGGGTATYGDGVIANLLTTNQPNTVNHTANAFFVKRQAYWNLTLSGFGNYYTGNVGITGDAPAGPTPIYGNLTLSGANVQLANDMPISGNLSIGLGSTFDPSCNAFSVGGSTTVSGTLTDGCGNGGLTDVMKDVTILAGGTWTMSDVTNWSVSGSITNDGTMTGVNYGSITLLGHGRLDGTSGVNMPNLYLFGSYEVATPLTVTTNIVLQGTLVMDVNNTVGTPNQLIYGNGTLFYGGNLVVNNTGPALVSGNSFQLFKAASYGGFFSETLPSLSPGLSWEDDTATTGSLVVTGGSTGGSPTLMLSRNGNQLTLSWDSATFPGYMLQTSAALGAAASWSNVSGGSSSPVMVTINPSAKAFYRLHHP